MQLSIQEIVGQIQCQIIGEISSDNLSGISTDSRHIRPGELFVALQGENFDGHDFVNVALQKGARAALVDSHFDTKQHQSPEKTILVVHDTLKAYQEIARHYRKKIKPTVVALTGSAGKTTCKEFIHAVLSQKYHVHKNAKSFNNFIGVPATLLELQPEHEILVTELGTSNFGEISHLSYLVEPDVCLLLNIGYAHLEFLKNLDGVAKAKMEIFDYAVHNNAAFYNADDDVLNRQAFPSAHIKSFSVRNPGDVKAEVIGCEKNGCYHFTVNKKLFRLTIPGRHNIYNALAGIAVGLFFDVPMDLVQVAIEAVTSVEHRLNVLHIGEKIVLDDAYNANPGSCAAALATLADLKTAKGGRRIAVLGDMLELGEFAKTEHEKLASIVLQNGVDALFLYGENTVATARKAESLNFSFLQHFREQNDLISELVGFISKNDVILVKGSHSMHMEHVVNALKSEIV